MQRDQSVFLSNQCPVEDWAKGTEFERATTSVETLAAWIGTDQKRFDTVDEHSGEDLTDWLLDFVSELSVVDRVDEAIVYCERFAEFGNPEMFLGERVNLLSTAGRHEEAIVAAHALLNRFPEHAWSHVFAADAFRRVGDRTRAESEYRRALQLDPTDPHTVDGVLERLVPWLERLGRVDEARRIQTDARSGADGNY